MHTLYLSFFYRTMMMLASQSGLEYFRSDWFCFFGIDWWCASKLATWKSRVYDSYTWKDPMLVRMSSFVCNRLCCWGINLRTFFLQTTILIWCFLLLVGWLCWNYIILILSYSYSHILFFFSITHLPINRYSHSQFSFLQYHLLALTVGGS